MNLVGKIFTVLIFVLSLVFASFTLFVYAAHKNWRAVVENKEASMGKPLGLKPQLDLKVKENETLRNQLGDAQRANELLKTNHKDALAKLETESKTLKNENAQMVEQVKTLEATLRKELADVKGAHESLENLRKEVVVLRKDIADARTERDNHFKTVLRFTDELQQAANELVRLKDLNAKLADQYANALAVLNKFDKKPQPELYKAVPPMVEGLISATPSENVVEVTIGSDDGLLAGHQLFVYRTNGAVNTLVGKIEVVKTTPDRSVCKVMREWAKSTIVKGDRVASQLQ